MPEDVDIYETGQMRLVLVHLGDAQAEHLWLNIKSILKRFPKIEIAFVSDRHHPQLPTDSGVTFFQYQRTEVAAKIITSLSHDSKFRSGFWHYTLERFLALEQYHQTCPDTKILHIESDILLLPNFPLEAISKILKLAWLRVDENRDVAAILYSPNLKETTWLVSEIHKEISKNSLITDMTSLNQIRKNNLNRIQVIPSHSPVLGVDLFQERSEKKEILNELSRNCVEFGGIFDPAVYGMWLTGSDPRNYYGKQIIFDTKEIISGGTYIDPSLLKYSMSEDGELFCNIGDNPVRIWSLHVHSKDLRLFGEEWSSRLESLVIQSENGIVVTEFHLKTLLKSIYSNFRDQTLISWVLHIPKLAPFVKFLRKLRSTILP
jgi:hypothetical protein